LIAYNKEIISFRSSAAGRSGEGRWERFKLKKEKAKGRNPPDFWRNNEVQMLMAVNGTLMRGQPTNYILSEAGAKFAGDARTAPVYRLWNVKDKHPGMMRDEQGGVSISLELWEIDPERVMEVFEKEPPGLVIGQVLLDNGSSVAGILAEPYILAGSQEITQYHGWREYQSARNSK
jgi:hypothetical protein